MSTRGGPHADREAIAAEAEAVRQSLRPSPAGGNAGRAIPVVAFLTTLSPVLWLELKAGSRRVRWIILRGAYVSSLFLTMWLAYGGPASARPAPTMLHLANLGVRFFEKFSFLQLAAVILATPAVVAGAVAQERERRTMEYLLASPLGSAQIVIGKLVARVAYVVALLAAGLPVLSLALVLGGIPPDVLGLTFAAAGATLAAAAGISLFVSVTTRRIRDALLLAYLAIGAWIALPPLARALLKIFGGGRVLTTLLPAIDAAVAVNPFTIQVGLLKSQAGSAAGAAVAPYCIAQVLLGAAFVILATLCLRPVYARSLGRSPRRTQAAAKPHLVGWLEKHPFAWKEMYVGVESRWSRATRWAWAGGAAAFVIMLMASATRFWSRGGDLSFFMLADYVALACAYFAVVKVLLRAMTVVPREKEHGCWETLLGTRLLGIEIVRGALWGALYSARRPAIAALCLWGSWCLISPWMLFTFAYLCAVLVGLSCFAGVVAFHLSLRFRSAWQANVAGGVFAAVLAIPFAFVAIFAIETGFGVHGAAFITIPCVGILGFTLLPALGATTYRASALIFDKAAGRRPYRTSRSPVGERPAAMVQSKLDPTG